MVPGKLSVFIPVYNEARILEKNVMRVYDFLKARHGPFEIIIIDDGSTDGTREIAHRLAYIKGIKHTRFDDGCSRRENLAKSFLQASGDIIVYMDADMATDLSCLPALLKEMDTNDISIGSRYVRSAVMERRLSRLLISHVYNMFVRSFFGTPFSDHQCGFKAFKRDVILDLVGKAGYDKTRTRGWFWDAEILIRAHRAGYRIAEVPVMWRSGKQSSFRIGREMKMLPFIIRLRMRLGRGAG